MKLPNPKEPLLLAHVVWMDRYAGDFDTIVPSAFNWKSANHRQEDSNEQFNFLPEGGVCRGYAARHYRDVEGDYQYKRVNLRRLGGSNSDTSVQPVTVIWTAMQPEMRRRVVVGWYRGARVFREAQPRPKERGRFYFEAPESKCRLLRPESRVFEIPLARDLPSGKGGPGHDAIY